jgi:hypothetical protein
MQGWGVSACFLLECCIPFYCMRWHTLVTSRVFNSEEPGTLKCKCDEGTAAPAMTNACLINSDQRPYARSCSTDSSAWEIHVLHTIIATGCAASFRV